MGTVERFVFGGEGTLGSCRGMLPWEKLKFKLLEMAINACSTRILSLVMPTFNYRNVSTKTCLFPLLYQDCAVVFATDLTNSRLQDLMSTRKKYDNGVSPGNVRV